MQAKNVKWGAPAVASLLVVMSATAQQDWAVEAEAVETPAVAEDEWTTHQEEPAWGMEPEPAPAAADPAVEMQQVQMELQQVMQQLEGIRQQAFQLQEVVAKYEAYAEQVREQMVVIAPEIADDLARVEDIMDELSAVEDPQALPPEELEELQMKYMEFQQMAQRLQPIEQQAAGDPEVRQAQEELEDTVQKAMISISPDTPTMESERDRLIQRYHELEQQIQHQQMQQQPMDQEPMMQQEFTP